MLSVGGRLVRRQSEFATRSYAPLSVLAGGLFAFAQLARENAVTIMRAGGVSAYRILAMTAPAALCVILINTAATELIAPRTDPALESWWRETAPAATRAKPQPKPFRVGLDLVVATAGDVAGRRLDTVSIYRRDPDGRLVERIEAPSATYSSGGWRLQNPKIVRFNGHQVGSRQRVPV